MKMSLFLARLPAFVALATACGDPSGVAKPSFPGCSVGALIGGASEAPFLAVDERQLRAVLKLRASTETSTGTLVEDCSGTLITARWVVTAAHCVSEEKLPAARVLVTSPIEAPNDIATSSDGPVGGCPSPGVSAGPPLEVSRTVIHPELDLALVELDAPLGIDERVAPIAASPGVSVGLADPVQIGGHGITETASELRFKVEPVVMTTDTTVVVSGGELGGACAGDSGGPLLVRDANGAVAVAGVLSGGARNCRGEDVYTKLDDDFIDRVVGSNSPPRVLADCGVLGAEGRCFGNTAVWCEGEEPLALRCSETQICGWGTASVGYRCQEPVSAGMSECGDLSEVGRCDESTALRCDRGVVSKTSCQTCGHAPISGMAGCL